MPTVQVGLSALTIAAPALPGGTTTLSVDTSVLPLVINADTNTVAIDVVVGTQTTTLTDFKLVNGKNQFTGSVEVDFTTVAQVVEISGRNYLNGQNPTQPLITPTIQFELLYAQSNLGTQIAPPSGVTIYKGATTCRVEWAIPQVAGLQGVRVQWSTDPSGVNVPFQQFGGLSNNITRTAEVVLTGPTETVATTANPTVTGQTPTNTVVTTSTEITTTTDFDSVSIPQATVQASLFYVILTTVVQDPTTNQVYESQAAGPFTAGYVNLHTVNPIDFLALQKSTDIAARMISEMTRRRPDLDLTARSEFRDLVVNPIALEIANISVREQFSRWAQSISALAQIDDQNGDGISDLVASSPIKQQLAQAYGLSQSAIQAFIDQRFDILGAQAGVPRGGALTATVFLTFLTYNLPTSPITIPVNLVCSTIPDSANPTAVSFITTGSATIDSSNPSAFYNAELGAWAVTVPAQAQAAGAAGNVGAETIKHITAGGASGAPSGVSVINLNAAEGGDDEQSNSDYAAMIQNRQVVGKDSGTRNGYWTTAMEVPGVINALVVAAGDLDMLRDWSSRAQKHTFGCVDIYARGLTSSQQTENLPFTFPATSTYGTFSTYLACTLIDPSHLSFKIAGYANLGSPVYTAVQMAATSAGRTIYLGVRNAQVANGLIYLDPNEQPFTINQDGTTSVWQINGADATNLQFIQALGSTQEATFLLMAQLQAGIDHVPALQPVTNVNSITGPVTGSIPSDDIELVHANDFLLTGGSNEANDTVTVSGTFTRATQKTLTVATSTVYIDSDISVAVDPNGKPQNILSVRSSDLSTVYTFGVDYSIVPAGPYRAYALQILDGSAITVGSSTQVVAAYNQFLLRESVTLRTDSLTLSGSTPVALLHGGFVHNTWLPANHGQTTLLLDGQSVGGSAPTGLIGAGVAPTARYIKVTYNNGQSNVVMIEGRDFQLAVNAETGAATITRVTSGSLPDGGTVSISYYTLEVLEIATEYPAFVEQLLTAVESMKHAGADVLIKAMIPNAIDFVFNVVLNSSTTPSAVDGTLRTQVALALNAANATQTQANQTATFSQSALVQRLQSVTGVKSVDLPLLKCARADGSYDIGVVIPTGTTWNALSSDENFAPLTLPANAFISKNVLLPNPTIPSGGTPNNYVGLIYESQAYRRALSIQDFLTSTTPSFYLIGANDEINAALPLPVTYSGKILLATPGQSTDPSSLSYRCTYQVYSAASADDITVVSPEYLVPGTISINYISES